MFFKFQSDSINTLAKLFLNNLYGKTLNSNLILLIRSPLTIKGDTTINFKFQSDSINTSKYPSTLSAVPSFKFQSDSINTRVQRHL